ncbi:MAG TPA: hypothetical protein GX406_05810 [Pseudoclavibacter sp.]|nr:hypothetical protein [Pseudoclavibacter sp.]
MKPARLFAPLVVLLSLAGCSMAPAGPAETTPTPASAPVEPWLSVIAEQRASLDEWHDDWEDATCSALAIDAFDCNIMLTTGALKAKTAHITVGGVSDPDSNTYLGDVPEAIEAVYLETVAATAAADEAGDAWSDSGCSSSDGACVGLAFDLERALDDVRAKFTRWEPYF